MMPNRGGAVGTFTVCMCTLGGCFLKAMCDKRKSRNWKGKKTLDKRAWFTARQRLATVCLTALICVQGNRLQWQTLWWTANIVMDNKYCDGQQILWWTANFMMDRKLCDRQQSLWQTLNFVMDSKLCDGQQILWWTANFVMDSKICDGQWRNKGFCDKWRNKGFCDKQMNEGFCDEWRNNVFYFINREMRVVVTNGGMHWRWCYCAPKLVWRKLYFWSYWF